MGAFYVTKHTGRVISSAQLDATTTHLDSPLHQSVCAAPRRTASHTQLSTPLELRQLYTLKPFGKRSQISTTINVVGGSLLELPPAS